MGRSFLEKFHEAVSSRPSDTAFIYYEDSQTPKTLSYGEVNGLAKERAQQLLAELKSGSLVFILFHDPLEQAIWWLGALMAAMVPGILTPPTPKLNKEKYFSELAQVLSAYPDCKIIVEEAVIASDKAGVLVPYRLTTLSTSPSPASQKQGGRTHSGPMLFQQSSGTTGLRKGVMLSEKAVTKQLAAYGAAIKFSPDDVLVSWLPFYHDMGLIAALAQAIYQARPLVFTSPFTWLADVDWLPRAIAAHQGTLSWLPNFAFNLMVERSKLTQAAQPAYRSLRLLVNCSEPVQASILDKFVERFAGHGITSKKMATCYAMAENVFAVTQSSGVVVREKINRLSLERKGLAVLKNGDLEVLSSGRVLGNVAVKIIKNKRCLKAGQAGEIHVKSDCLMNGYFGVGATQNLIKSGWLATGDIGYLRKGELFVIGRSKDLIIRGGRNIDPIAVEAVLGAAISEIKPGRIAVVGVPNQAGGTEDLIVLAEFGGPRVNDLEVIKRSVFMVLSEQLDLVPQSVEIVRQDWLIKSSSGKISRKACREKYLAMLEKRRLGEIVVFEHGDGNMQEEFKDAFGSFGTLSRIRTPTEIGAPGGIHIGNWVSLGRFGKLLMQTDFTSSVDFIKQHYPEVKVDYAALDPKVFGKREPIIKIGDGTSIGDYFFISAASSIVIGKHVMMSARVFITDSNHLYQNPELPVALQSNTLGTPMVIGDHSWIGVGACLLEGAQIGKHCVVSSNTVVNFPVPDYAVVAGNPARVVKIIPHGQMEKNRPLAKLVSEPVSQSAREVIDVLREYVQQNMNLAIKPDDSLFRSGLIDSLRSLSLLQYLENTLKIRINDQEFFACGPDTAQDIAQILKS